MNYAQLLGPLFLFIVWSLVATANVVSPLIIPSPLSVIESLYKLLVIERSLVDDVFGTLARTLAAFLLAAIMGTPIGLLMGYSPRIYRSAEFIVDFFRSIPPIVLFPLFLLVFGLGEGSRLAVPLYGCTLVVIVNSIYGILNAPRLRRTVGKVYGLSGVQIFTKIAFPDALPQIFVGYRTALSLSLVLTIVVEMLIGSKVGLGKKIYDFHLLFETAHMYASIIVTGTIGYVLNQAFLRFERRIVHWADK